jgi:hypothetical protein
VSERLTNPLSESSKAVRWPYEGWISRLDLTRWPLSSMRSRPDKGRGVTIMGAAQRLRGPNEGASRAVETGPFVAQAKMKVRT